MLLEILIPTFNREKFLIKNLDLLNSQISKLPNPTQVGVIISDNCSSDDTVKVVQEYIAKSSLKIRLLQQDCNRGLEINAVNALYAATAPWVMFLGDDDYLPDEYLEFIIEQVSTRRDLGCIIPGSSRLYSNGDIKIAHGDKDKLTYLKPGFKSVLKISYFGHQLSGLTFLRDETMIEKYTTSKYRNIQLFIYFIAFNINIKSSIYAEKYKILVSHFNHRHWNFDESGLLIDNYLNYLLLYQKNIFKGILACIVFTDKQKWRLRIGSIKKSFRSLNNILHSNRIPISLKGALVAYFIYASSYSLFQRILR
ncbi:glycosyltransferase family 2 protein [Thermosynechococcaceae cyanobacterium BACA0444]|uniref:Glycosyltransferase family 2 protein n=1 Tax=Pseudocalidococcus azoricus BACA0444 TaxID=2918990 RepID=A0AAE4FQS6_9CYAN|nr:glycosyltransferase family 2 protein [Pseudocalidococcus azoricus]MDS3859251.1 glycosyltransferase family 2 protein [Pseudocalidococcus azoricus BACA0444]